MLYLYILMIFVERKCWILTFKGGYTFFAGHLLVLQVSAPYGVEHTGNLTWY